MKEELTRICGDNKNELRRKSLCFVCKGSWALNYSCPCDRKEATRIKPEGILSNHEDSFEGSE